MEKLVPIYRSPIAGSFLREESTGHRRVISGMVSAQSHLRVSRLPVVAFWQPLLETFLVNFTHQIRLLGVSLRLFLEHCAFYHNI